MSMQELDKDTIWVIRGAQRKVVFLNMPKDMFMPNKLRKELNAKLKASLSLREISRHLRGFEQKGLIKCSNHDDPYNKIYILSDKGKKLQESLISLHL